MTFANQTSTGGMVLYDIEPVGEHVFVSGIFSHVNGVPRASVAMLALSDASLAPFSVQLSNSAQVRKMSAFGEMIALCGLFTTVNGVSQRLLAFVTATEGRSSSLQRRSLPLLDGDTLYVVGDFNLVNGEIRHDLAIFRWSTAELLPYGSLIGGYNDWLIWLSRGGIERSGDTIVVYGPFTSVSSIGSSADPQAASGVFSFLRSTGQLLPGVAVSSGEVWDLELIGNKVLLGGRIRWLQGPARAGVAALALNDGALLPITINVQGDGSVAPFSVEVSGSGQVRRIRAFGEVVALCGTFSSVNAGSRRSVAFVSAIDGSLLPFTASFQGVYFPVVRDVLLDGDTLYMVGEFGTVNAEIRSDMAVFRWSTAELLPLGFELSGWSDWLTWLSRGGIERAGDTITVFGPFSGVSTIGSTTGSQAASGVFSFLRSTGQLLPGTAPFSGEVRDLEVIGDKVLLGGRVSWLYGPVRAGLAALDLDDGSVLPFEVDIQGVVHAMAVSDGHLYLGGAFTSVNGVAVPGVARLNALTGELVPFVQPISWGGYSYAFEVHQGRVFMGSAQGLLVHDAVSGAPLPWNWTTNDAVSALDLLGDRLYIGGSFTVIGGVPRTRAAAVHLLADVLLPWVPIADAPVVCLSAGDKGIAMAGPTYGGMLVVDAFTGERLPVYRPFSDTGLIPCHVLSTHDDLLIAADPGTYTGAYSTSYSESYNMPNGGRSSFSLTSPGWLAAGTLNAYTPIAALQAITLTTDRIYMGGLFQQAGAHYRHNLAVFSRPVQPLVQLDLRASLGGVQQEAGLLSDALRAQGLLPAQEPYTSLGVEHQLFGGGEGVDAPVLAISDSTAVVDWVLVELRAANDPAEVLATRNGLLRRDGRVVDVDGRSALTFPLMQDLTT